MINYKYIKITYTINNVSAWVISNIELQYGNVALYCVLAIKKCKLR